MTTQPTTRRKHVARLGWGVAVGLFSVAGIACTPGGSTPPTAVPLPIPQAFSVSGRTGGLYPGRTVPLALTITNETPGPIIVTSISTSVGNASVPCRAANLKVSSFSGRLLLAARQSAHATVEVTMAHSAPDSCQRAIFPFSYSGLGYRGLESRP